MSNPSDPDPHATLLEDWHKSDLYPFTATKNTTSHVKLQEYYSYWQKKDVALFSGAEQRLMLWGLWDAEPGKYGINPGVSRSLVEYSLRTKR